MAKLMMGGDLEGGMGPQTTLDSLLLLTEQTLKYEEQKKEYDEKAMEAHSTIFQDPLKHLMSQHSALPLQAPTPLAYYDVDDAMEQRKVVEAAGAESSRASTRRTHTGAARPAGGTASATKRRTRSPAPSARPARRPGSPEAPLPATVAALRPFGMSTGSIDLAEASRTLSPEKHKELLMTTVINEGSADDRAAARQRRKSIQAQGRWKKAIKHVKKEIAGYKTRRRSATITPQQLKLAESLVTEGHATLRILVQDPMVKQAARKAGVDLKDLRQLPRKYFRTEPNSPIVRDKEAQSLAFNLYEEGRIKKLGMILSELSNIKAQHMAEAKRHQTIKKRVVSAFWDIVGKEEEITDRAEVSTNKAQKVLVDENKRIREAQAKAKKEAQKFIDKTVAIEQAKLARVRELQAAGRRKQVVIENYQEQAEHLEAVRAAKIQHALALKELRLQAKQARDAAEVRRKAAIKKKKFEDLKVARDQLMERQRRQRDRQRVVLQAKHAGLDEIKKRKEREMKARQAKRSLLAKEKVAKAARQRKEREYEHQLAGEKTKAWFKRIELIDEMRQAAKVERGRKQHDAIIRKHKFQARNPVLRNITPGPGAYTLSKAPPPLPGGSSPTHRHTRSAGELRREPPPLMRSPFSPTMAPSPSRMRHEHDGMLPVRHAPNFDALMQSMGAGGDTSEQQRSSGLPPSGVEPSASLSDTINSRNRVGQYDSVGGTRKPAPASMGGLFSSSTEHQPFVSSDDVLGASYFSIGESPPRRGTGTAKTGSRRKKRRGKGSRRDSLDKLYEKPPVPYTALRSVEGLVSEEVSLYSEEEFVDEVARARATLRQERRAASRLGRTSFMDRHKRWASKGPGPGEYVLPKYATSPVAKWGEQSPKSDVEWQIYRAKQLPGPGEYPNVQPMRHTTSARFGNTNTKGEFEWIEYRAKQIPGPADYDINTLKSTRSLKQLKKLVNKKGRVV